MPEIQGPSFDCPDLCVDLPSDLGPSLCLCPLFLREPPVGGVQRREPRSALLCPGAGARASVEPAASYWELGWPLAKRASSRSRLALGFIYYAESVRVDEATKTAYQANLDRRLREEGRI